MIQKRVTSKDVAKAAGVSQATVSYVLNNNENVKIKSETKRLVFETAAKLNYHTNYLARSMRLKKASAIGIVTDKTMSNYLFMNVLDGIKDSLMQKNYSMTLCFSRKDNFLESEYIQYFHSNLIDGVIFAFADISDEELQYMTANGIPYISIHAHLSDNKPFQVKTNILKALIDAISQISEKCNGNVDIGYLGMSAGNMNSIRFEGFVYAMQALSCPIKDDLIIKISTKESDIIVDEKQLSRIRKLPRAIVCDSIYSGFFMLRYANSRGIKIPDELSIVAICTSPFSQRVYPALSCVEAPLYNMGFQGSEMLMNNLDNKIVNNDILVMEWKFVKRESS